MKINKSVLTVFLLFAMVGLALPQTGLSGYLFERHHQWEREGEAKKSVKQFKAHLIKISGELRSKMYTAQKTAKKTNNQAEIIKISKMLPLLKRFEFTVTNEPASALKNFGAKRIIDKLRIDMEKVEAGLPVSSHRLKFIAKASDAGNVIFFVNGRRVTPKTVRDKLGETGGEYVDVPIGEDGIVVIRAMGYTDRRHYVKTKKLNPSARKDVRTDYKFEWTITTTNRTGGWSIKRETYTWDKTPDGTIANQDKDCSSGMGQGHSVNKDLATWIVPMTLTMESDYLTSQKHIADFRVTGKIIWESNKGFGYEEVAKGELPYGTLSLLMRKK